MMAEYDDLLTTEEACEALRIGYNTLYKLFFFEHFGEGTQLEEMRQAEAKKTGKLPSPSAMTNRKNKIIDKAAKPFGVLRVKRHKYSKRTNQ